jgi:tripartite-type tricarboxylate transporter receptor subunit TctC
MNHLGTGLAALVLLGSATATSAQTFPSQDLHFVTAYPAGSSSDGIVRFIAERMRPLAGRTILVENKVGANGAIATEYTARAKPDGHTIFIHAGSAVAGNMALFKNPTVDAATAIQMVGTINRQAFMLAVAAGSPYKSVAELTAAMKAKGAKGSFATYATTAKIMGELYRQQAGLETVEVSYKVGADTLNDLKSGALDFGMYDPVFAMAQQRNGNLRILGVAVAERLQAASDLPTLREQGHDIDLPVWFSMMVPAATPKPVVAQLNAWLNEVVKRDDTKKFLNGFGADPWISTPEEAQARLLKDIKDWAEYVRVAKIEKQ